MINIYCVYILKDELGDIRYVGISNNPDRRLHEHKHKITPKTYKDYWVRSIDYKIEMEIIEKNLDNKTARQREIFYVEYYKNLGCRLTNTTHGGDLIYLDDALIFENLRRSHPQYYVMVYKFIHGETNEIFEGNLHDFSKKIKSHKTKIVKYLNGTSKHVKKWVLYHR